MDDWVNDQVRSAKPDSMIKTFPIMFSDFLPRAEWYDDR
jgi:hypothetical protein